MSKIHFWVYKAPLNSATFSIMWILQVRENRVASENLDGKVFKNASPWQMFKFLSGASVYHPLSELIIMAVGNSWHFLGTWGTAFWLPKFISNSSVDTHLSSFFVAPTVVCTRCGHTWTGISLSPILEVQGVEVERENCWDPMDPIPIYAWVMQQEGNMSVLIATKEDVIYSHPLLVRYKPVPFITQPPQAAPS